MPDIVELAISGNFTKLVAALTAAGLIDTLKGPGPFTVFAPTDEAFDRLPLGLVDKLMKGAPISKNILLYHVIAGKMTAEEISKLKSAKSLQGQELRIEPPKGFLHKNIRVNGASVIKTDIMASNGVCHAIDSVLVPK
jgi:uncharacterized surface protein with fasciclin (FAS1) repeats